MNTVNIIGSGNVAFHFIQAFLALENQSLKFKLQEVYARKRGQLGILENQVKIVSELDKLSKADITMIMITDSAVSEISSLIPYQNTLVVHTSGSLEMNCLNSKNRKGVFYPLQTFSKQKPIDFSKIPLAIEAEKPKDYIKLIDLALLFSKHIYSIDSEQRKALHVSAVFACNFVNHLYQISADICQEHQIPFEILKPLIQETAEKIKWLTPKEAQTGPAKRKDFSTLEKHNHFLLNNSHKEIYNILSKSIIDNE
jgi:predicted short-subunit dehydrogenase-like oxidoreductase (DUF2520 family)